LESPVPRSLEECFAVLKARLSKESLEKFKNEGEEVAVSEKFWLGIWIRDVWGLWDGSQLAKYFRDMGVDHPNDMSTIIMMSFHRYLNDEDIKLEEQIKQTRKR